MIDGTFDDKADEDKLNLAIYHTLSRYERPYFRILFLKHLDDSALKSINSQVDLTEGDDEEDCT